MSVIVIPVTVVAIVYIYCQVCGKDTKQFVRKQEKKSKYQEYQCDACNVIQRYKVK